MKRVIDISTNEPKERSLLFYLVPTTLIGFGMAAALIFAAPVGAAITTAGVILSSLV
jgi:hypothetical protein